MFDDAYEPSNQVALVQQANRSYVQDLDLYDSYDVKEKEKLLKAQPKPLVKERTKDETIQTSKRKHVIF